MVSMVEHNGTGATNFYYTGAYVANCACCQVIIVCDLSQYIW